MHSIYGKLGIFEKKQILRIIINSYTQIRFDLRFLERGFNRLDLDNKRLLKFYRNYQKNLEKEIETIIKEIPKDFLTEFLAFMPKEKIRRQSKKLK